MPNSDNATEEAIRARLREIVKRYPQAEIARRLNMRRSTVNRYLLNNRIPGAFLAGVAKELGVNTSWLMLGEGVPWIADVRASEASMGRDLLELVQAMEQVSRLRLGALAGKSEAMALRELSDAIQSHERLSARLTETSRATYMKILDDWYAAMMSRNLELANQLSRAAAQIERLCPDPALQRRHEAARAAHEQMCGRAEQAIVHRKNVFASSVGDSGKLDARGISAALGLAVSLDALSRTHEARAVLRAALSLGRELRDSVIYAQASAFLGWTDLELGFVARGMKRLHAAMAVAAAGTGSENLRLSLAYGSYVSGSCGLTDMLALCGGDVVTLGRLRALAAWSLELNVLEKFARQCAPLRDADSGEAKTLRAHLASLQGRHRRALEIWDQHRAAEASGRQTRHISRFSFHVMHAQLLLRAGRAKLAQQSLQAAERVRREVPQEFTLESHWLRLHWRNAALLEKPQSPLWRAAVRFAKRAARRGLVAFAPPVSPVSA